MNELFQNQNKMDFLRDKNHNEKYSLGELKFTVIVKKTDLQQFLF